ncbi:MAG: hypothetical protein FJX33_16640 [Alphaproteobacteria bacterium]|nr:hypothetical protein [Alphaproteobacteria bacterium]
MSQKSSTAPARVPAEKLVRDIRRATRKHHSAEDKIRMILEGLRDKSSQLHRIGRRSALPDTHARRHRRYGHLSSHQKPAVRAAIRARGARLLFLPPYSPDLNPIEQVFAKRKHRL